MTIRRVVPNIASDRLDETRRFYLLLGFEVVMDVGWIVTFASPANPTAQISVARSDEPPAGGGPFLTVEVVDVDAVHATVVAAGCDVVEPLRDEPWGVRRFSVRDPNGTVLNVMTHLAAAGSP